MSARRSLIFVSLLGLTGLAAFAGWMWRTPELTPALTLQLLDGSRVQLKALRGRPVLVSFWSLSCGPCLEEIPVLRRLHQDLTPRGLEIVAIAMAYDPPAAVLDFVGKQALPYRVALDLDGAGARAFGGVPQLPRSFVIGPDGAIAHSHLGKLDLDGMRAVIQPLLR